MSLKPILTVLDAAASYDLTDLATVKTELSITDTSNDSWLTGAITQISRNIARYTNRTFAPEYVRDTFNVRRYPFRYKSMPAGATTRQLTRWPLLSIASLVQTMSDGTTQTLVEGVDFTSDPATGELLRLNADTGLAMSWEEVPTAIAYTAGFGAFVQETHTVPGTPFQVTVADAATFSCTQAVTYASGAALAPVAASPAHGQYIDGDDGAYTFALADVGQQLGFAYATFVPPADLVQIALQLITARFRAKGRDPALMQRDQPQMGTERYWVGGQPGQTGAFPPDLEAALADYRVPTVA